MEETPKVHSRNRHHHHHQHHSNANSSSSRHRQREQRRDGAAAAAQATTATAAAQATTATAAAAAAATTTATAAGATVAAVVTANVASAVPTTTIAAVQLATQKTTQSIHVPSSGTFSVESADETLTIVRAECATPTPSSHTDGSGSGGGGGDSTLSTHSHTQSLSPPTVVLVNGRLPTQQNDDGRDDGADNDNKMVTTIAAARLNDDAHNGGADGEPTTTMTMTTTTTTTVVESPTQQQAASSRNSSGDAMSLRETLQQLPASTVNAHHHHHHHHHHHRQRQRQPSPQAAAVEVLDSSFHRGILGYMDRELKQSASPTPSALSAAAAGSGSSGGGGGGGGGGSGGVLRKLQSLSDPQASPAQRSIRSRSSLEKSPRRKRSKSESRRRRERKLIAAGEMEVRQANETLMRYLKQCSEMNDASLSGELEIDHNYDERRVHRKTKSQRDKRGHIIHKLYTTGGLSSILKELSDDIVPADGEEIYNPFTPVVSPTDDMPTHIDKMFLQTSSGYRPVERCYYKHPFAGSMSYVGGGAGGGCGAGAITSGHHTNGRGRSRMRGGGGVNGGLHAPHIAVNGDVRDGDDIDDDDDVDDGVALDIEGRHYAGIGGGGGMGGAGAGGDGIAYINRNYCDTHYLLAAEYERPAISTNIHLACVVQRIWHLISNICHGLIAGLALAHLILVLSTQPTDWQAFHHLNDNDKASVTAGATAAAAAAATANTANANVLNATRTITAQPTTTAMPPYPLNDETLAISHYATFADVYLNTFYCLALLCLISVFDRMDICSWQLSAHSHTEFISFRWLIIAMIYIVTIILTICSTTIDEQLYYSTNANVTLTQTEVLVHSVRNMWNSLAVTRSIAAICGWLLIGTTPQKDMLYEHLVDLSAYQLTNN